MIGTAWRMGNLGLAFLVELGAVAALAYAGFRMGTTVPVRLALGIGAPAAAIVLWGLFAAPRATVSVPVLAAPPRSSSSAAPRRPCGRSTTGCWPSFSRRSSSRTFW